MTDRRGEPPGAGQSGNEGSPDEQAADDQPGDEGSPEKHAADDQPGDEGSPEKHAADDQPGSHRSAPGRRRAVDRRRIDEIFGESWPATTEDERGPGERGGFEAEHYRRNRPPHHLGR